jgi:hypothetical protein
LSKKTELSRIRESQRAKAEGYEAALNNALAQFVVEARTYLDASARSILASRNGIQTALTTSHLLHGASERLTFVATGADIEVVYEIQVALRSFATQDGRGQRTPYDEIEHLIDVLQRWRTDPKCDAKQAITYIRKIASSGGTEHPLRGANASVSPSK